MGLNELVYPALGACLMAVAIRLGSVLAGLLRRLRERRQLSQSELARKAKVGRVTLNRLEGGTQDPTLGTLERLAKALGVRLRDLLPDE